MAAMTAPLTATAAGLVPSGSTVRRDRTTRSYLIRLPPAEARRAVRRVRRLVLAADPAGVSLRRELAEQRQSLMAFPAPRRCSVRATRQSVVYRRKLRLHFRITDEFGACSSSQRRRIVSACLRKGLPMSGVRVLVGTRKGAFVLRSDGKRDQWDVSGPHFPGWEIYHLKGSPADQDRLYAPQSNGWFGQLVHRSDGGGATWEAVGN